MVEESRDLLQTCDRIYWRSRKHILDRRSKKLSSGEIFTDEISFFTEKASSKKPSSEPSIRDFFLRFFTTGSSFQDNSRESFQIVFNAQKFSS